MHAFNVCMHLRCVRVPWPVLGGCVAAQDVYRIGTLLELMREVAFTFAAQGKRDKVSRLGASPRPCLNPKP